MNEKQKECQYLIRNFEEFWKIESSKDQNIRKKDWENPKSQHVGEDYYRKKMEESVGKYEINQHSWAHGVLPSKLQEHLHRGESWDCWYSD